MKDHTENETWKHLLFENNYTVNLSGGINYHQAKSTGKLYRAIHLESEMVKHCILYLWEDFNLIGLDDYHLEHLKALCLSCITN